MSSFEPAPDERRERRFVPDPPPADPLRAPCEAPPPGEPDPPAAATPVTDAAPRAEAEAALREAYERGLGEGRATATQREAALETAAAALQQASLELAELGGGYLAANRRAAVELALAIAERILARELERDPDAVAALAARAFEKLDAAAPRVLLSERDHATLGVERPPALERLAAEGALEVDPGLRPGEVRVEAPPSQVDARLPELLRRVREELDLGAGEEAV